MNKQAKLQNDRITILKRTLNRPNDFSESDNNFSKVIVIKLPGFLNDRSERHNV